MIVALGAAAGMTLAGLGIAGAQVDEATGPRPAAVTKHADGRPRHPRLRVAVAAAAKAIGISEADLVTAVKGGQSVAQVAQAHGVTPQAVVDALVAAGKQRLAAAVAAGRITQAQADARGARLAERATRFVNHVRSADDHRGRGRRTQEGPARA
ncbi:MAG TPA: hypothetical protein VM030_07415 [Acidimicrobiales bacterium]|nr:hypothetical protein [Acidimicrobiales bacterium]